MVETTKKLTVELINNFLLTVAPGGVFSSSAIASHYEVKHFENKDYLRQALHRKVKDGELVREGKKDGWFRKPDTEIEDMDWENADPKGIIPLKYPYGVEDNSTFNLENCVQIFPKDLIVIAGTSNSGKTLWALNFIIENMDTFPCIYWTNEFSPQKFHARIDFFDWVNIHKADGTRKFRVVEKYDNFEDVILPDAINVIDWIELTGESGQEFYRISGIMKHIQEKLRKGICVIVLQKKHHPNTKMGQQDLGVGGEMSLRRAALYINIDYQKLTVKKCKSWIEINPNNRQWRFDIIEHGSRFHRIEEIGDLF